MKNIDLRIFFVLFILVLVGIVSITFSDYTAERANRMTTSSRAASSANQQCNVNPSDKCSQGVLSSSQCQFQTDWNSFTISGNPNIGYTNYTNMGPDPRSVRIESSDGKPFSAGVYITFNTTPGKTYCASWRWGPNTKTDGVRNSFGRTIGLDPSGGTNAQSSQIIWGNTWAEGGRILDYDLRNDPADANIDVKATAQSNTMTIFLRADYNASENSFLLIDMVNVYDEGTSQTVPPTAVPAPPTNTPRPTAVVQPTTSNPQPTTIVQPTTVVQPTTSNPQPTAVIQPTTALQPTTFNQQPTEFIQPTTVVQPTNSYIQPSTVIQPTSVPIEIKSPKEIAQEVINPESISKLSQSTDKPLSAAKEGFTTVKSYDQKLEQTVQNWWMNVLKYVKDLINSEQ